MQSPLKIKVSKFNLIELKPKYEIDASLEELASIFLCEDYRVTLIVDDIYLEISKSSIKKSIEYAIGSYIECGILPGNSNYEHIKIRGIIAHGDEQKLSLEFENPWDIFN